jgi:putative addiction module component (TIGR02574 family)
MSSHFDEIAAGAMRLAPRERVRLAQQLVSSLEDQIEIGVEDLWEAEAERRLQELRTGTVKGIEADEAFRNARKALKD